MLKKLAIVIGGLLGALLLAAAAGWFFVLRAPSVEDQCAHLSELVGKDLDAKLGASKGAGLLAEFKRSCPDSRKPPKYGKGPYASVSKCIMKATTLDEADACKGAAKGWDSVRALGEGAPPPLSTTEVTRANVPAPPALREIELAATTESDFGGYRISLPKDSKTVNKSAYTNSYSHREAGEFIAYDVSITKSPAIKTLAAAEKAVRDAASTVAESRELGKGDYFVAAVPLGILETVYTFKPGPKGATLIARCSGPTAKKAKLVEICSSLAPSN